jgi:CRISPR/Cas system-associated endonuclease Cas1
LARVEGCYFLLAELRRVNAGSCQDPQTGIKIGRLLISEKTREQYSTLEETLAIRERHLKRTLGEIKRATDLEDLSQVEARAASAYFRHFKKIKIR